MLPSFLGRSRTADGGGHEVRAEVVQGRGGPPSGDAAGALAVADAAPDYLPGP